MKNLLFIFAIILAGCASTKHFHCVELRTPEGEKEMFCTRTETEILSKKECSKLSPDLVRPYQWWCEK